MEMPPRSAPSAAPPPAPTPLQRGKFEQREEEAAQAKAPDPRVGPGAYLGALAALARELDFTYTPLLFELDYDAATRNVPIRFQPVSSFPQIRRDISFTVAAGETFGRIAERVSVAASTRLHELRIFDIYLGESVESGRKSVALGLILQDLSRTLRDAEADEVVAAVCAELRLSLDAKIRE